MSTVLFADRTADAQVEVKAGSPWLALGSVERVTGWHVEDRGVCRGDQCIPVPTGERWSDGEGFDLGAFAEHRGQGRVRAEADDVWSFGPPAGAPFESAEAPDFALPDFGGRVHRLSDYRGRKVALMTWASW